MTAARVPLGRLLRWLAVVWLLCGAALGAAQVPLFAPLTGAVGATLLTVTTRACVVLPPSPSSPRALAADLTGTCDKKSVNSCSGDLR